MANRLMAYVDERLNGEPAERRRAVTRGWRRSAATSAVTSYSRPPERPCWTWANGTPRERAEWVRSNARILSLENLRYMFNLTTEGAWEIVVKGDEWRPEHSRVDGQSQT